MRQSRSLERDLSSDFGCTGRDAGEAERGNDNRNQQASAQFSNVIVASL
jgi:hypothetical protein